MKTVITGLFALLCISGGLLAMAIPLPPIVKCQIIGTKNEFSNRGDDCSPEEQQAVCSEFAADPKIGPAKPIGCKTFTSMDAFVAAAKEAVLSRNNPQPPSTGKPKGPAPVQQIPVVTTCKINDPASARKDFVAVVSNDECVLPDQQKACDLYAQVPGYGPAKPVGCQVFKTVDALKAFLKQESKTGRYPGMGGLAVLCETRGNNEKKIKYKYAEPTNTCDPAALRQICQTAEGIADPIGCGKLFPDAALLDYLNNKNPKQFGLECQLRVGGSAYRVTAPDCSPQVRKVLCNQDNADVKLCGLFSNQAELTKWAKAFPNNGFVTCRHSTPTGGVDVPNIPARDCSLESQQKACFMATPVGCKQRDIEGIKAGTASWDIF